MLVDAASPPTLPTVTLPSGAPWGVYALSIAAPVVVYVLWLFRHAIERLGEREPAAAPAASAHGVCADCTATRAEAVMIRQDVAALRAEVGAAHQKMHSTLRQIADLQAADSKVLEGVSESATEHGKQLTAIDKTVTLIDRDSFRREPTR